MTPNKHLICLAQSHGTFWCVALQNIVLHWWGQFFFHFLQHELLFWNFSSRGWPPIPWRGYRLCPFAILVTGFSNHWEGRDVSDPWIIRFFFLPHKTLLLVKGKLCYMNLGTKLTEKRIRGKKRGETSNAFPSFARSSKRLERKENKQTFLPFRENNIQEEKLYF